MCIDASLGASKADLMADDSGTDIYARSVERIVTCIVEEQIGIC